MPPTELDQRAEAVRRFNRFYTAQIGLLDRSYLESGFSLTEVRVLYELSHRKSATAGELSKDLGLDPGYLSRILRSFEKRGLVAKKTSSRDARQVHLSITTQGQKAFAPLDAKSHREISELLGKLNGPDQQRLIEAMRTIETVLGAAPSPSYLLRPHQPGDMGWVIHRHGALYSQEYGYDLTFEALVAEIAARFIQNFDPKRERCWIAERDGAIVGSVFLVKKSEKVAKLRMLLVEPSARGLGIGNRLVEECTRFARQAGYRKITLWTQSELVAARNIYRKAGYRLVKEEPQNGYGAKTISETWELEL